jgi:hypothetical protein
MINAPIFRCATTKTGNAAIGSISRETELLLTIYILQLPFTLHPNMPIFHTRGGEPIARKGTVGKRGGNLGGGRRVPPKPYSKDMLSKDFRKVRDVVFPGDKRKIIDFRRSGAVEATVGKVDPAALAGRWPTRSTLTRICRPPISLTARRGFGSPTKRGCMGGLCWSAQAPRRAASENAQLHHRR